MKSLPELRKHEVIRAEEITSRVSYFNKQNIDYDVFLETKGFNLQRDFVWSFRQKQEIIHSLLLRRHIPHLAIYVTLDDVYQIIDGKQRLSSILEFVNGEFPITLEGKLYNFADLPEEYRTAISMAHLRYYIVYEKNRNTQENDQTKITWFKFLNFAGTLQELDHLNKL